MTCPLCDKLARLDELPPDELVWQFPHSVVLLGPWQFYTGYCVVVARRHATELFELSGVERTAYFDEMTRVAQAIADVFHPRKMNYELLGNQVPHLHAHLFPRQADDPAALQAVWLALDRAERDEAERRRLQSAALPRADIAGMLRQRLAALLREDA